LDAYRARGYQGDEIVGLSGLELWGESYLAGTRGGVLSAYTSSGQYSGEIARRDALPAQSLYTTLDRNLQAIVQDTIEDAYRAASSTWAPTAGGAAVVVMDVNTGNILAMASYPYFDPNVLNPFNNHPLLTDTYISDLLNNPRRPFFNRATQGEYPPGSLFKVVTMSAALGSGLFQPATEYTCNGVWTELGPASERLDWKEGGHGTITLVQGLAGSCNPYFYHIGLVTGQQDFNILPNYAREYGFGSLTDIQIDEESGLIPDPDWLFEERGQEWTLNDSVNMAIGQGDVLVTPLQMAVAISAIANGGTLYRPNLVDRIGLIGEEPSVVFEPHAVGHLSLTDEQIQAIREGMRGVTTQIDFGTAEYRLGSMEIPVAGKTGTAQVSQPGVPPIAWFGGYAPYENPEIAVVVMIENGGQGSGVAAPIFRRIIERWYDTRVLDYPPDWFDPELFEFVEDIGE
jgi:penicillin-binding protein 2